jgi:hypothetical protein
LIKPNNPIDIISFVYLAATAKLKVTDENAQTVLSGRSPLRFGGPASVGFGNHAVEPEAAIQPFDFGHCNGYGGG